MANVDEDGLSPFSLLCPGTSGFTIFLMNLGDAVTHIASSPITRVVSMAATMTKTASIVGNAVAVDGEINNTFAAQEVGGITNAGQQGPGGPGHGILPLTKYYSGPFDNETLNEVVSEAAEEFGTDIADKEVSKWVTKKVIGKNLKNLAGDLEDSDGDLPIITYQQMRNKSFPVIGNLEGDAEEMINGEAIRETIFHMSESRGYKGIIKYISRGQENAPIKFSAIYLTDNDVLRLENQGALSLKGRTIYGPGSTFSKNPSSNNRSPFTHLLYFPSQFYRIGKVLLRFIGIVPINH